MAIHPNFRCDPIPHSELYSFRNWSKAFKCHECGRVCRVSLNFLGQRVLLCDGKKFSKVNREIWLGTSNKVQP